MPCPAPGLGQIDAADQQHEFLVAQGHLGFLVGYFRRAERLFLKRFARTHRPLPSQKINFSRLRCAFENRKICPLSGSHDSRSRTNP